MTVGKPVSSNFYPNTTNTNGVAIEPNNAKATKNEKGVALPLAEADSFQSSTTPRKVATSEKAPPPPSPTTPQGISPLMVGAGMLTTLLVGAGAVWIAGSNNWIELGQKAKTTVTKELPDAVAKFLRVTNDATDEVTTNAIKVLEKETQDLKDKLKNNPANSDLQTQLDEAILKLQQAYTDLTNEQKAHNATKFTTSVHEGTIQDLQHQAGVKDTAISDLGNQVKDKQNDIVRLQETIRTTGEQLTQAQKDLEAGVLEKQKLEKQVLSLEEQLKEQTTRYNELLESNNVDETLRTQMNDLKTAKEQAEQKIEELTEGNQVLIANMHRLEADNQAKKEALGEASVSIYVLTEGKEKLVKELEQLQSNLAEPSSIHQQQASAREPLKLATFTPVEKLPPLPTVGNDETLYVSVPPISQDSRLQLPRETHIKTGVDDVLIEDNEGRKFTIKLNQSTATNGTSIPVGKPQTPTILNVDPSPLPEALQVGKTASPIPPWSGDDPNAPVAIPSPFGSRFQTNMSQLANNNPESTTTDVQASISSPWNNLPITTENNLPTSSETKLHLPDFLSEDETLSSVTTTKDAWEKLGQPPAERPQSRTITQFYNDEAEAEALLNQTTEVQPPKKESLLAQIKRGVEDFLYTKLRKKGKVK